MKNGKKYIDLYSLCYISWFIRTTSSYAISQITILIPCLLPTKGHESVGYTVEIFHFCTSRPSAAGRRVALACLPVWHAKMIFIQLTKYHATFKISFNFFKYIMQLSK